MRIQVAAVNGRPTFVLLSDTPGWNTNLCANTLGVVRVCLKNAQNAVQRRQRQRATEASARGVQA